MTLHRLSLIHPFDPRSRSTGPLHNRLRAMIASQPVDFSLLVVGADLSGDLELGVVTPIEVADRRIDFLPVTRRSGGMAFALGILRYLSTLRAAARGEFASTSAHGFAWVPFARIIGRPVVFVVHRDPRADAEHPSRVVAVEELIALHTADRIVGCDAEYVRRCRATGAGLAAKTELLALPTSFDAAGSAEDAQMVRLWERHRRLFDAQALHRGQQIAV